MCNIKKNKGTRMTKDEALKMALSALDEVRQETFRLSRDGQKLYAEEKVWSTIISIKEALAQPEQEPMHPELRKMWEDYFDKCYRESSSAVPENFIDALRFDVAVRDALEWEKVDMREHAEGNLGIGTAPTPLQRTWVGLTKEEIAEFDTWHDNREEEVGWCNPSEIVAYIEAKLKQKNGYAEEKNT